MRTLILALIAFSCNFTFANGGETSTTIVEGQILTIDLTNYPSEHLAVAFSDNVGNILHTEDINSKSHTSRRFNLKGLTPGNYIITLNTDERVITKKLELNYTEIHLYSDIVSFKPSVEMEDNKWNVNLLAKGKKASIAISNEEETLHNETINNQESINKTYDLNNLENGEYNMIIRIGDRTYYESYTKK